MKFFFNQPKTQNRQLPLKIEEYAENSLHVIQEGSNAPVPAKKLLLSSMLMAKEPKSQFNWYSQNTSSSAKGAELEQPTPLKSVTIELRRLLERIPADLVSEGTRDPAQTIQFDVQELVSQIGQRKPIVMLSTIAKACPELFAKAIPTHRDIGIFFPWHEIVGKFFVGIPVRHTKGHKKTGGNELQGKGETAPEKAPPKPGPESKPVADDFASPDFFETSELEENNSAPSQTPSDEASPDAGFSQQSVTGEGPSVEAIAMERDEAIRQRDEILAKYAQMEEAFIRSQEVIEASQDSARVKELVNKLTGERDDALNDVERLKTALWHTSEALQAVHKTSAKGQDAV